MAAARRRRAARGAIDVGCGSGILAIAAGEARGRPAARRRHGPDRRGVDPRQRPPQRPDPPHPRPAGQRSLRRRAVRPGPRQPDRLAAGPAGGAAPRRDGARRATSSPRASSATARATSGRPSRPRACSSAGAGPRKTGSRWRRFARSERARGVAGTPFLPNSHQIDIGQAVARLKDAQTAPERSRSSESGARGAVIRPNQPAGKSRGSIDVAQCRRGENWETKWLDVAAPREE